MTMRLHLLGAAALMAVTLGTAPAAAVKRMPYPEIKVELLPIYEPEPGFAARRKAFAEATAKKDAAALLALVAPTFVWTAQDELAAEFDLGRDALYNFEVVFAVRSRGKEDDRRLERGPV